MSEQRLTPIKAIEQVEERFKSVAPAMSFESEKGFAIQVLANNPYLMGVAQNHPVSLMQAVSNVAAIGLSLNPAEKLAYLISRNVKEKTNQGEQWVSKVFLEPSYMGLCKLATDSGSIKWIQANVVYSNDEFVDNGPGEKPTHRYNAFANKQDRGEFVGAYCVAKTAEGDYLTTPMSAEEIYSIRDRSEAWKRGQSGPWKTDFTEQAKKTVVRRAFKMWPRTNMHRLAAAVELSNNNEGFEPILSEPNIGEYNSEQKAYFDSLIEKSDSIGMATLQQTLDEKTFVNLYHSFPKGQKGKYQQIVDRLIQDGSSRIIDCVTLAREGLSNGDDGQVFETIDGLPVDTLNIILSRLTPAEVSAVNQIKEAQQ